MRQVCISCIVDTVQTICSIPKCLWHSITHRSIHWLPHDISNVCLFPPAIQPLHHVIFVQSLHWHCLEQYHAKWHFPHDLKGPVSVQQMRHITIVSAALFAIFPSCAVRFIQLVTIVLIVAGFVTWVEEKGTPQPSSIKLRELWAIANELWAIAYELWAIANELWAIAN
jgi:hypothetical protein